MNKTLDSDEHRLYSGGSFHRGARRERSLLVSRCGPAGVCDTSSGAQGVVSTRGHRRLRQGKRETWCTVMRIRTEPVGCNVHSDDHPIQTESQLRSTRAVRTISSCVDMNPVPVASGATAFQGPDPMSSEDRLLRATEIQRELGVSRATAYRMMTDGTLPSYRFGGRGGRRTMIRVSLKELRSWIAARRNVSSGDA